MFGENIKRDLPENATYSEVAKKMSATQSSGS